MRSLETKGKKTLDFVNEIPRKARKDSNQTRREKPLEKMTMEEIRKMIEDEPNSISDSQAVFDEMEAGKATVLEIDSETIDTIEAEMRDAQQRLDSLADRAKGLKMRGGDDNDR